MNLKAVGWVRVRLLGAVSGKRLSEVSARMRVKAVRAVRGGMEMDVRANDLNELRKVLYGAGLHMRIVRRYGIVRVRAGARRKASLIMAACCAVLVLWGLAQTVFAVSVVGARDTVQEMQMRGVLDEFGVKVGMFASNIDKEGIAGEVMARFPGLTFAMVRRQGLSVELYVVQATHAPEVYDPSQPVDVVATYSGLVTKIVVLSGEGLVKPGDTVVKGQVLIAGTAQSAHARGAVTARIWCVGEGQADLRQEDVTPTGRVQADTYVRIGSWRFPETASIDFEHYQTRETTTQVLDGMFYPVEWVRCEFSEVSVDNSARKISAVKDESGARGMTNALLELPNGACVVDKRVEYSMIKDGKLCATVTLESIMQIGQERLKNTFSPQAGAEEAANAGE